MFNLQSYLGKDTNLIEFYYIKPQNSANVIDIRVDNSFVEEIKAKYRNWKTTKYMAYSKNHLTYLYDLTDDNQVVYTKVADIPTQHKSLYIVPFAYSKLPTYIFPCVNDIDNACEYTLTTCSITNRITVIIRNDEFGNYAYVEYKHSPNVDVDKIQDVLQKII